MDQGWMPEAERPGNDRPQTMGAGMPSGLESQPARHINLPARRSRSRALFGPPHIIGCEFSGQSRLKRIVERLMRHGFGDGVEAEQGLFKIKTGRPSCRERVCQSG